MAETSVADATETAALQLTDWKFTVDLEGLAWAEFDRVGESANALGKRPLEELGEIIAYVEKAAAEKQVRGLGILSGKPGSFILGADIREFDNFDNEQDVVEAVTTVTALFDRIEALPVPVVVGIHGFCLGGGLELALACHYRIATRDEATRIGFPEVKLGLFPGFNGTARSIRQAGPIAAMDHMLTGRFLRATQARAAGYIDQLVEYPKQLRWAVRKAILQKRRSKPASSMKMMLAKWPLRGALVGRMRKEVAKKAREDHYPAPYQLLRLFEKSGGSTRALKRNEARMFAPLMVGDTSRNLRRVFRLQELLKSQAPKGLDFKPRHVHVIGAGTMGADIAGWCVANGMMATLQDLSAEQIQKGIKAQDRTLKRKFRTPTALAAARARLIADPDGVHIGRADVVIEAIVEKLEVKQQLFREIEPKLKPGAVMATNTSSIMIEDISEPLADPGRIIGIHFFNPVAVMPLVEVIRGSKTWQEELDKGCAFVAAIGKSPLIVKSGPGFLVNRVLAPYMFEAMSRLEQGEQKERIDEAAKVFGMPMGPIELADTVGLDICANVGKILGKSAEGSQLEKLVSAGRLGKKSGRGFYEWKDGKPVRQEIMDKAGLDRLGRELVEPLIDECERCLDEGVVASADLVDAGVIFGTGFAPFRGGPLHYRRTAGERGGHSRQQSSESVAAAAE